MDCATNVSPVELERPEDWIVDPVAVMKLDLALAQRHAVLPLGLNSATGCLHLAMTRPEDSLRRAAIQGALGADQSILWHRATDYVIREGLERCYPSVLDDADHAVRLADELLYRAVACGGSDVHVTPGKQWSKVRVRVDGSLRDLMEIEPSHVDALTMRLKVMAELDIAESRKPQDGRLYKLISARPIEMRVSSFPLIDGENLVIRLHDGERHPGDIHSLGTDVETIAGLSSLLKAPPGLIVVCGPTGSGKTTTLYAMLKALDDGSRSLMTLEDPVEHRLDGVSQTSVDPSRAIDFASGIRALLRQDPDVLMIGEIRDAESCRMAVRAAMSGLRVLATVHANDSCSVVARLLELGADSGDLADTLVGTIAQRLLRKRGRSGRLPIFEILHASSTVRAAIRNAASVEEIAALAFGARPRLARSARMAVSEGRVDARELTRVFGSSCLDTNKESHGCAMPTL